MEMANENLKNALKSAGLTPEDFADIIRVDPKSVQRWVEGPTKPYPRNRAAIARALNLTESDLWPDETAGTQPGPGSVGGGHGPQSEVTGTWGSATDENAPDPVAFIENTDGTIDLLDNGRGIRVGGNLIQVLIVQARAGRGVRLLTSHPGEWVAPLIGPDQIEVRVTDAPADHSLLRAGDSMLFTFDLAGEGDEPPPLIQLQHRTDGRLYDRLAENLEALWQSADPLSAPEQLDAYITNTDEEDHNEEDPALAERDARPGLAPAPRRWPRRPD
jgi:transcriptional regulator with XRE-family HTH domain